jgi:hypothetical protein
MRSKVFGAAVLLLALVACGRKEAEAPAAPPASAGVMRGAVSVLQLPPAKGEKVRKRRHKAHKARHDRRKHRRTEKWRAREHYVRAVAPKAAEPNRASKYSCTKVRWAAATFSADQLEAMAQKFSVTPAERAAAQACLRSRP